MRIPATAAALAAAALLAACAPDTASTNAVGTVSPAADTAQAPPPTPPAGTGPGFTEALIEAYGAMAQFESRAGTPEDAAFFRAKQQQVTAGTVPAPEPAPDATLQAARGDLVAALGYRDRMPIRVATAQAAYDCWANDAAAAADPVPVDCPRLFRDTIQEIAAAR